MIKRKFEITPSKLYPTESLFSIEKNELEGWVKILSEMGAEATEILVFEYEGDYYIIKGHHQMLAANMLELSSVIVLEVDCNELQSIYGTEDIVRVIEAVSKTTLYDFEAIGNFRYEHYPRCYA